MFDFLQFKVSSFQNDIDKECGLVIDKISITPKRVYDSSTKILLGNITFPNKEGGLFLGDSFDGAVLKDIILQIIYKAEIIGLHVNYITSDMDLGNGKLWKCCGINVRRYSDIRNCIPHPSDPNRFLYFIADVPHFLKNVKESLLNNKFFILREEFVNKYKLPCNRIEIKHFNELIESQKDLEFFLTPRLNMISKLLILQ